MKWLKLNNEKINNSKSLSDSDNYFISFGVGVALKTKNMQQHKRFKSEKQSIEEFKYINKELKQLLKDIYQCIGEKNSLTKTILDRILTATQ